MHRMAIQIYRMREGRDPRVRRSNDNGARIVEAYFAVLTIVIVAMIVGIGAYAVHYVLPDWETSHSPRIQQYPLSPEFQSLFRSHSSERR